MEQNQQQNENIVVAQHNEQDMIFQAESLREFIRLIRENPEMIKNITPNEPGTVIDDVKYDKPTLTITYANGDTKTIEVGSSVTFPNASDTKADGSIQITVDGVTYYPNVEGIVDTMDIGDTKIPNRKAVADAINKVTNTITELNNSLQPVGDTAQNLLADEWEKDEASGGYIQTLAVEGVKKGEYFIYSLLTDVNAKTAKPQVYAWGAVYKAIVNEDNEITFYAFSQPKVDLSINIFRHGDMFMTNDIIQPGGTSKGIILEINNDTFLVKKATWNHTIGDGGGDGPQSSSSNTVTSDGKISETTTQGEPILNLYTSSSWVSDNPDGTSTYKYTKQYAITNNQKIDFTMFKTIIITFAPIYNNNGVGVGATVKLSAVNDNKANYLLGEATTSSTAFYPEAYLAIDMKDAHPLELKLECGSQAQVLRVELSPFEKE